MNAFKRFALILMSCCVMLSGCGRANESEDSAPDGIIEITPTTQAEEMPEEYDDYGKAERKCLCSICKSCSKNKNCYNSTGRYSDGNSYYRFRNFRCGNYAYHCCHRHFQNSNHYCGCKKYLRADYYHQTQPDCSCNCYNSHGHNISGNITGRSA